MASNLMGLSIAKRCSGCSCDGKIVPLNPDPSNFIIIWTEEFKHSVPVVVACVRYPDCPSFEANKIIIFKNMTTKELIKLTKIDPHFKRNSNIIARFSPEYPDTAVFIAELLSRCL